jgi:hypothetical protein
MKSCEGKITSEEIRKVLKKMYKNKAPGIDGIPMEFYLKYEFLDDWLAEILNSVVEQGQMTETMRTAVIKPFYKKGDRRLLKNYRPISLLTADYKILAKVMTERMKPVLKSIIKNDQQGFIEDGEITGNLMLVKAMIDYCNDEDDAEAAIILMDFMKAYDRVDRTAMMKTLKEMGFGPEFRVIETMYTEVGGVIEVNGEMTDNLITQGGVRQGCPLSPYLFICVLELMAIEIRQNTAIEGITEPITKQQDKISLFADDSIIGVRNNIAKSVRAGRQSIKKF